MKWQDFLTERMVFGVLIIGGFVAILHELLLRSTKVDLLGEVVTLLSAGLGALGAAIGIIVQSIWKVDRAAQQASETTASLAATVAKQADTAAAASPSLPQPLPKETPS